MLDQLPLEILLAIFGLVFPTPTQLGYYSPPKDIVRVSYENSGATFTLQKAHHKTEYVGAMTFLSLSLVGPKVAAAATEALVDSDFMFTIDASVLHSLLNTAFLSRGLRPQQYLRKVRLLIDEDVDFVGDGDKGEGLRQADWVELEDDTEKDDVNLTDTRLQSRRQCWRDILNIAHLEVFELSLLPAQGRVSFGDLQNWEIRDFLPTYVRLRRKGVFVKVSLRLWERYEEPGTPSPEPNYCIGARFIEDRARKLRNPKPDPKVDPDGYFENELDLSCCFPWMYEGWQVPPEATQAVSDLKAEREHPFFPPHSYVSMCAPLLQVWNNEKLLYDFFEKIRDDLGMCLRFWSLDLNC